MKTIKLITPVIAAAVTLTVLSPNVVAAEVRG